VLLSNPKVLVFFGAFIPQFVDMKQDHLPQVVLLGATFMVIAGVSDGALRAAGRARAALLRRAGASGVAHLRRLHDRRRHLARPDPREVDRSAAHPSLRVPQDARETIRPFLLAALLGDQILPDLDAGIRQAARLAMNGNAVIGRIADRIGLVVADDELVLLL
jgi:hypothetical protein